MINATTDQRMDRKFVMRRVKQDGWALGYALKSPENQELKSDKQLVLEAIRLHGQNMEYYVNPALREDKDVVLEAVKKNGLALGYCASEELQNDKEVLPCSHITLTHFNPTFSRSQR